MDVTFKSCSKQFAQLYTIHVDCGSTISETNVYSAIFALLPVEKVWFGLVWSATDCFLQHEG